MIRLLLLLLNLTFFFLLPSLGNDNLGFDIITDFTVNDCLKSNNDDKKKYFDVDMNGFPFCGIYDITKQCDPEAESPCEPGLKCNTDEKTSISTCSVVDEKSCFKYYANIKNNENIMKLLWTPDCLEYGYWAAKQCKGGPSGRCFCYDMEGNRLFGNSFYENSINMTCACSRKKSELLKNRNFISFHCDDQGNYEKLQCEEEHCWCADFKTGELKSMIVPEKAMKFLDCASNVDYQYLQKCESQALAQAKIIEVMKRHGTTTPNIQIVACENDGAYGPYAIQNTNAYCVDKYNKKLDPYQTKIDSVSSMDCNCARDEALYAKLGKQFSLECDSKGSYKPLQSFLEDDIVQRFCVDKDGNKKVDNVDEKQDDSYCNQFYD